jgi:hypothetical protein
VVAVAGTVAAFVTAYNVRFGTSHAAKNFNRDFRKVWLLDVRKPEEEIDNASKRMRALHACTDDPVSVDGAREF